MVSISANFPKQDSNKEEELSSTSQEKYFKVNSPMMLNMVSVMNIFLMALTTKDNSEEVSVMAEESFSGVTVKFMTDNGQMDEKQEVECGQVPTDKVT